MIKTCLTISIGLFSALHALSPVIVHGSGSPKNIIEKKCSGCHPTGMVYGANKSEEEWEKTIDRMVRYGTRLADNERKVLIQYLSGVK